MPQSKLEQRHRLRLACGNGLRGDIWEEFQERFSIPQILEFYASTEGNFSLYNVEGKAGAVGKIPPLLAHRFPAWTPIGRIGNSQESSGRFEGYTDARETEKKVLHDVFVIGDSWFRTGDLMRLDAQGYFHFIDRIGDTFRWKVSAKLMPFRL